MLLKEFDKDRTAVIEPYMMHNAVEDFPESVISIFSHRLFGRMVELLDGRQIAQTKDVDGIWPIWEVHYNGHRFALCKARLEDKEKIALLAFELACRIADKEERI